METIELAIGDIAEEHKRMGRPSIRICSCGQYIRCHTLEAVEAAKEALAKLKSDHGPASYGHVCRREDFDF